MGLGGPWVEDHFVSVGEESGLQGSLRTLWRALVKVVQALCGWCETLRGQGDLRKVFCNLGRGSFNVKGGREGDVRQLGALRATLLKRCAGPWRVVGTVEEQWEVERVLQSRKIKIFFGGLNGKGQGRSGGRGIGIECP